MEYIKFFVLILCLLTFAESLQKNTKDAIGFPEVEENYNLMNKQNRHPVFIPSMCPENELFYPGDQKDDWICDCRPSYIFHPKTDACWPAYQRGPCQDGFYLTLTNSVIPTCVRNPCVDDNQVKFKGKCEKLGATEPCGAEYPTKAVWVNATTLAIECVKLSLESRFTDEPRVEEPKIACPRGCKRNITNRCSSL